MTKRTTADRRLPEAVAPLVQAAADWKRRGLDHTGIEAEAAAIVDSLSEAEQEALVDGALALLDGLYARIYADIERRAKHRTVPVPGPDGEPVEIDEGVAPLIAAMWANGWTTYNSCEDDRGWIWVEMPGSDVERFLTLVARKASPDIAWGAQEACSRRGQPFLLGDRDVWDLSASAHDLNEDYDETGTTIVRKGRPDIAVTVGVRFPPHHLDEVTAIVAGTRRARRQASPS